MPYYLFNRPARPRKSPCLEKQSYRRLSVEAPVSFTSPRKKVIGNQTGEDNQTGPTTSIGDAVERKPASGERPTVPSLRHMR